MHVYKCSFTTVFWEKMNGGRTLAYAKICLRTHGLVSPLMPLFDKFSDKISTCRSKRVLVKKQSLCQLPRQWAQYTEPLNRHSWVVVIPNRCKNNNFTCQQQNKAIPKSRKRDVGMALSKVMDGSASAETVGYLYEPLPVEKFKWQRWPAVTVIFSGSLPSPR